MAATIDRATCPTCSQLEDFLRARQRGGREEEDTFLPSALNALVLIRDLNATGFFLPGLPVAVPSSRLRQLRGCDKCGTLYLFVTDYEYLATGSEDEQTLTRLSVHEASRLLRPT